MQVYRLEGNYYTMGFVHGQELARNGFTPPPASEEKVAFANDCAEVVQEHAPELLEELRGMAKGGGFDWPTLQAFVLTLGEGPGCSVVAISGRHTADGKGLFGRNFDFANWDLPYQQLYRTYPGGSLASLGGTDVLIGREDGVNEAGLVMAQTHVAGQEAEPGVLFSLVGRMLLDRCRNVNEAVELLQRVPHVRANNWLLMDADDTIAVVETSPSNVAVNYAETGFAVATNHFREAETRACEASQCRPPDSERRLCTLESWFEQRAGRIDRNELCRVLSSHDNGVCVHRADLSEPLGTLRSLVVSPGERQAFVTADAPCRAPYVAYTF